MSERADENTSELSLVDGLTTTRAIRRYTDDPVTDAQLAKALHLATRAPSGSNRQPFRFIVLRSGPRALQARQLLAEGAAELWRQKRAADEFPTTDPTSPTGRMLASMDAYVRGFAEVPVVVLPCLLRYRDPTPTEGASVYPAVQNLLLGARAVGLGGAITMFHRTCEAELASLLELPEKAVIAATVTLGVPEGKQGPVRRRPLADLVFEDGWGESPEWAVDPEGTRFTSGPRLSR